jgi:hypothetical protein
MIRSVPLVARRDKYAILTKSVAYVWGDSKIKEKIDGAFRPATYRKTREKQ